MNNNKNPNLPANAVSCADAAPGMVIVREGVVQTITTVRWFGFSATVHTDMDRFRVNRAGTLRLA